MLVWSDNSGSTGWFFYKEITSLWSDLITKQHKVSVVLVWPCTCLLNCIIRDWQGPKNENHLILMGRSYRYIFFFQWRTPPSQFTHNTAQKRISRCMSLFCNILYQMKCCVFFSSLFTRKLKSPHMSSWSLNKV